MTQLPLAVDIAETVSRAEYGIRRSDAERVADDLLKAHPESGATRDVIIEVLVEEAGSAATRFAR